MTTEENVPRKNAEFTRGRPFANSARADLQHKIIRKGLALPCEQSATVPAPGPPRPRPGILPRRLCRHRGASVVTARLAVANRNGGSHETHRHPARAFVRGLAARG